MSVNARLKVFSLPALTQAWNDLVLNTKSQSRNTTGVDGISINDFAENSKYFLLKLFRELKNQKFHFSELKAVLIKKPNGKDRLICVPTVKDRIVQRALLNFLAEKYHNKVANDFSYGFIKGRSVKDAADLACALRVSKPWVFKTDITAFFDTIDRAILQSALGRIVRERSLHPILFEVIDCEAKPPASRVGRNRIAKLGIAAGRGLRQGMPLSPFLSNLLLTSFDEKVISAGIPGVRYADDLVFFASSHDECLRIAKFCETQFLQLQLSIPKLGPIESKSVIYAPAEPAEFLGLELAPSTKGFELRLSDKQIERISDEMRGYGSVKELLSRKITLRNLGIVLRAKCNGYLTAYDVCTNIGHLEAELNAIERKCLIKIYRDELKIDLTTISAEASTFLGLGKP